MAARTSLCASLLLAFLVGCGPAAAPQPVGTPGIVAKFGSDTVSDAAKADAVKPAADATHVDSVGDVPPIQIDVVTEEDTDVEPDAAAEDVAVADESVEPSCGDGSCDPDESCADCPEDCAACPASCGDATCDADESCKSCPGDCGICPNSCGDNKCASPETCKTCPADCGKCPPSCGDKTCGAGESCKTCPGDCGACPAGCGDGSCDAAKESCTSCQADCGVCPGSCSPLTSQGCAAVDQCYTNAGEPACAKPGTSAKGAACKFLADCAKGMLCVNGSCATICDASGASLPCTLPAQCGELSSGGKPIGWNLGACIGGDNCNVLTNSGCTGAMMCIPLAGGKGCIPPGTVGANQVCKGASECDAKHLCVGDGAGGPMLCKLRCNANGGAPTCPNGACDPVSIGNPPKAAPDNLGACP